MASRPLLWHCPLDLEFDHTGIIPFPKRELSNGPIGLCAQVDYASVHFSWADTAPVRHFVPQSNQRSSNRILECTDSDTYLMHVIFRYPRWAGG